MSTFDTAVGTVHEATIEAIHKRKSHAIYARNDLNNHSARWPVPLDAVRINLRATRFLQMESSNRISDDLTTRRSAHYSQMHCQSA